MVAKANVYVSNYLLLSHKIRGRVVHERFVVRSIAGWRRLKMTRRLAEAVKIQTLNPR